MLQLGGELKELHILISKQLKKMPKAHLAKL